MSDPTTISISRDGQQYGPYTLEQVNGYWPLEICYPPIMHGMAKLLHGSRWLRCPAFNSLRRHHRNHASVTSSF